MAHEHQRACRAEPLSLVGTRWHGHAHNGWITPETSAKQKRRFVVLSIAIALMGAGGENRWGLFMALKRRKAIESRVVLALHGILSTSGIGRRRPGQMAAQQLYEPGKEKPRYLVSSAVSN